MHVSVPCVRTPSPTWQLGSTSSSFEFVSSSVRVTPIKSQRHECVSQYKTQAKDALTTDNRNPFLKSWSQPQIPPSALRRKIPGVLFQLSKKLLRLRIISIWREFFKDINGLWSAIKVWSVFLPKTTNPVSRLLMVKLVWMVGSFKDRLKGSICVGRRRISIWGNKRIKHFLAWSTRHSRETCSLYLFEPNSKAHQKFRLSLKTVGKIS